MAKLTVLTSAYKAEKYIKEYLKSVLSQTYKDFEVAIELVKPSSKELKYLEKRKKV